jgi:ATP-dependent RNA helicase DDX54/DBP10
MKRKRSSPAASENEFDISSAIAGAALDLDDNSDLEVEKKDLEPWRNDVVNLEESGSESDGDEAFIAAQQAASNRKSSNLKGRTVKKGGGFQAMGLNAALLKAITRKGFSVPTPIQRKTIPLVMEGSDVVGMARTGSGKTAAFVIPMIEKLKAHSAKVGARAIIMSPSRELALQTLKVVKEMGRGTDLRCVLLVGGDSLEEQFSSMTSNPDIVIATPGRFLHLKVEMKLDLSSIQYVVFDEADRLFEMGFAVQLTEIMVGLPTNRQTLLFSATLPKSLVEFARAGLQEPKLVRLDAESKISPDLSSAFFMVKNSEKEGALLQIIQDVIKIPSLSDTEKRKKTDGEEDLKARKKRKRITEKSGKGNFDSPTEYSTIVFAATKHHVEYLVNLLKFVGYSVSYVYGALDQTARKMQVQDFRDGTTNILVVTDVAARGIDIPVLANVINYDFPSQPKVFVHRVGRTARAGKKGWSYSLLQDADLPYMLDLQLFLSRKLILGRSPNGCNCSEDIVVGTLPHHKLGASCEWATKIVEEDVDLDNLRQVAVKGERLYVKTRNSASTESVKRSKELQGQSSLGELCALFEDEVGEISSSRDDMLARLKNFRPQETVFEFGKKGFTNDTVETIRKTRQRVSSRNDKQKKAEELLADTNGLSQSLADKEEFDDSEEDVAIDAMDSASEDELEVTFSQGTDRKGGNSGSWQDSEHFMTYNPRQSNIAEDRGYGVISGGSGNTRSGSDFFSQAKDATMDLFNDEVNGPGANNRSQMRWDKRSKKYVARANDEDGSKGAKMVRGESGLKIAASLRSGRFDSWRKANNVGRLPRVGETEATSKSNGNGGREARYRHKTEKAPKEADRWRDDYHVQKKRVADARENRVGRFKDGAGKNELRSLDDVRKQRQEDERKKNRSSRGSSRGGSSRGGSSSRGASSSRGGGSTRGGGGAGGRGRPAKRGRSR